MEKFYVDEYLSKEQERGRNAEFSFESLCALVNLEFQKEWEDEKENIYGMIAIQKNAIIGYENEVLFFKNKIKKYIKSRKAENTKFPKWYESLEDGIYQENWGLASVAEWFSEKYKNSSSCKIIGERIYFQENGRLVLKPQKISKERREQLVRAFLLLSPEERMDKNFHEIYGRDGTRITIFRGEATKENQDVIVFRRYIIPRYTLEEQANRKTIPREAIPFFEAMVKIGYNFAITGAMKSGKTSFLATLQSLENPELEGLMLETDPEISLHKLMPEAPVVQLLAREDTIQDTVRHLLRSDADYLIMAEARDGLALDTALRISSKGTGRTKITFHEKDPKNFPYDVASEIVSYRGGNHEAIAKKTADSFDYIIHFIQLKNKDQKRLKSIHEMKWDRESDEISIKELCRYDVQNDCWKWTDIISEEKKRFGEDSDREAFMQFQANLKMLSEKIYINGGVFEQDDYCG